MARTFTFYFTLKFSELDALVSAFQKEFDDLIKDSFTDDELEIMEKKLDALGAVYVNPILDELTFDDFEANEMHRSFFESCKSSLLLEELPYLETNPFQVSWLELFLERFGNFLADRGNLSELIPKKEFLAELSRFKTIDVFTKPAKAVPRQLQHGMKAPVLPIDFLIFDVYKEITRLQDAGKMNAALEAVASFEKARRLYAIMKEGKLDAHSLLSLSGFIPKDFDDNLEKLKFILRKV